MARGTTLANLRSMLKAEIGDYSGTNAARDAELGILLSNKQKWLASEYDWPFLQHFWDVGVVANTQYLNLPTTTADTGAANTPINIERPIVADGLWNNYYRRLDYGIEDRDYNALNAALGQTNDPIQRWRLLTDTSEPARPDQFEVWPVPATNQTVRFTGQRLLQALVADGDKADLDDMLLVYFVAGEQLQRSGQPDAQTKLAMAQQRMTRIRGVYPSRDQSVVLGRRGNDGSVDRARRLVSIAVAH